MKKFLALLLAAAMTLVLAGCAQKADQPEQGASVTTEETTELANASETSGNLWTIDVLTDTILGESSIDTTVGKKLAEDFGIAFNFSTYSGDLLEKQALMLAGGDYNEIQYMQGQTMVQKYIDAGALLNLDDYKDFLPDFYEKFADVIPIWRTAAKDGGLTSGKSQRQESLLANIHIMTSWSVPTFWNTTVTRSLSQQVIGLSS